MIGGGGGGQKWNVVELRGVTKSCVVHRFSWEGLRACSPNKIRPSEITSGAISSKFTLCCVCIVLNSHSVNHGMRKNKTLATKGGGGDFGKARGVCANTPTPPK